MGFGLLLIGYFFANIMSLYSTLSFSMLVGYPIMIYALWRLAPYHTRFRHSFYISFGALPFAVYFTVFAIMQWCGVQWALFEGVTYGIFELGYFLFSLCFHFFLLYSVAGLAGELRFLVLQSGAWRNLIMMALYAVIDAISRLPIPQIAANPAYFAIPVLLLKILFLFLNMWLFFQCYRKIAPEDEDVRTPDPALKKRKKGDDAS
ncbi:MAG: hypothetical protein E7585_00375 [Ruminococcaceae bacterium]|nr:hypothetical protein [Oscillospiraceae bacterium]